MKNIFNVDFNIGDDVKLLEVNKKTSSIYNKSNNINLERQLSVIDTFPDNAKIIKFYNTHMVVLDTQIKTKSGMMTEYISIDLLTKK